MSCGSCGRHGGSISTPGVVVECHLAPPDLRHGLGGGEAAGREARAGVNEDPRSGWKEPAMATVHADVVWVWVGWREESTRLISSMLAAHSCANESISNEPVDS